MEAPGTSYASLPVRLRRGGMLRHLQVRPHAGADGLPKDRTAFVNALPAALDEGGLLELLGRFGAVERVAVHGSRRSAVVLYEGVAGRDVLLAAAARGKAIELDLHDPTPPYGLKAWVEAAKAEKPGNEMLQAALDKWIEEWEAAEEERRRAALAAQEEEGWTVVQRHKGRKRNTSATGVTVAGVASAAAQAQAAAKVPAAFSDFYRFQQREKRRSELLDLRSKFEQDKKRLQELKEARAQRKFKPY